MNFGIILSQNQTPIFKYIVWVLGKIMEGIFWLLDKIGIPNIGLAIIIFTIVVNLCMLPLTYKQQKFSKLSQKVNPEINVIRKKYEGKKDQDSQMSMNNEIQAVYGKYGISPTGSCLFLLIQMPILFALYRVIYQMPGYVHKIREAFDPLVGSIAADSKAVELVRSFKNSAMFSKQFDKIDGVKFTLENTIVDCLNRASTSDFETLKAGFSNLSGQIDQTLSLLHRYNNFLGLNIGDTPWYTMRNAFASGAILLGIGAILIPLLAGATQWLNVKLSPQPQNDPNEQSGTMASSMKMMNYFMPLMSIWFCFTLPAGMGLYWIASAVVRGVIMVIMNKKIDKMDFEKLIAKNSVKNEKKIAKRKAQQEKFAAYANMNTKKISSTANSSSSSSSSTTDNRSQYEKRRSDIAKKAGSVSTKDSPTTSSSGGGMMAKANAVKSFNEKNNK